MDSTSDLQTRLWLKDYAAPTRGNTEKVDGHSRVLSRNSLHGDSRSIDPLPRHSATTEPRDMNRVHSGQMGNSKTS